MIKNSNLDEIFWMVDEDLQEQKHYVLHEFQPNGMGS